MTAFSIKLKITETLLKVKSIPTQFKSIAEKLLVTITFFKILPKTLIYQLTFKLWVAREKRLRLGICGYTVCCQITIFCFATTFFSSGSVLLKIFLTFCESKFCFMFTQLLKVILSIAKIAFNIFLWVLLYNRT